MGQIFPYRTKYTYKDKFHALRERYEQVSAVRSTPTLPNPQTDTNNKPTDRQTKHSKKN